MNLLNKLLADNRGRGLFRADASEEEATIFLYDAITSDDYWGGVTALAFAKALAVITAPTIHLRINCPGGDVFAGQAMAQAMREHPANIIAHVDGYAASAASWVALAADEVTISPGGFFMIHCASTMCWGNAQDMQSTAALLAKIDATLVAGYAKETGQDAQQLADWMAAETWFTAEEAVANGFADRIAGDTPNETDNLKTWNLSAYAKAPQSSRLDPANQQSPRPVDPPAESSAQRAPAWNTDHLKRRLKLATAQSV